MILVNTVTQTVMRILRMVRLGATMCIMIMMERTEYQDTIIYKPNVLLFLYKYNIHDLISYLT